MRRNLDGMVPSWQDPEKLHEILIWPSLEALSIYLDLEDAGSAVIQDGELFLEQPGGTYIPVSKVETVKLQREPARSRQTRLLAPLMPEERKRRELELAELMVATIEDILGEKTIGWEAAAKLVTAIEHAYPELLERNAADQLLPGHIGPSAPRGRRISPKRS